MSAQVDHDLLADYVGGALDGTPEHERVTGLIASSAEWGRAADELTAALLLVSNDLNVLSEAPEPMPEDVAARFDSLFDAPRRDPLAARVVTGRSGHRAKMWKRWAAPVAIAAAALGFFAIGNVPSLVKSTMPTDSSESSGRTNAEGAPAVAQPSPVPTVATWRMYDRGSLASPPTVPFSADAAPRAATEKADATTSPLQRLTDPFALQQCLNAVTAALPGQVVLVEYAYFEGSPTLVISITSPNGSWRFVAGPNCGQPGPDERFRTPSK